MASIEARLVAALEDLRKAQGTNAVLRLQLTSAEEAVSEVRDILGRMSSQLTGDDRKEAIRVDLICSGWERKQERIHHEG